MKHIIVFIIPTLFIMVCCQRYHACETDADCTSVIINSICSNNMCICPLGYKSNGSSSCIVDERKHRLRRQNSFEFRVLGESCEWTGQCRRSSDDLGKLCIYGQCQCLQGFIPVDAYRCIQDHEESLINAKITQLLETEPLGFGSECTAHTDCQQLTDELICINGLCSCQLGSVPLGKYICYNLQRPIIPMARVSSSPLHLLTSSLSPLNGQLMKWLGKLGNSCTDDYFCRRSVPESHCYNGRCTCIEGYMPQDIFTCGKNPEDETTTTTLPPIDYKSLLGGPCSIPRNCHTSVAICLNSVCTCPKGYFAVDNWSCLPESGSFNGERMEKTPTISETSTTTQITTTMSTTTIFRWWPWSPTPTTARPTTTDPPNTFRVRCLLNRQCASMDKNSHCTLFGRCVCNQGYQLETTTHGQHCVRSLVDEDDCD